MREISVNNFEIKLVQGDITELDCFTIYFFFLDFKDYI